MRFYPVRFTMRTESAKQDTMLDSRRYSVADHHVPCRLVVLHHLSARTLHQRLVSGRRLSRPPRPSLRLLLLTDLKGRSGCGWYWPGMIRRERLECDCCCRDQQLDTTTGESLGILTSLFQYPRGLLSVPAPAHSVRTGLMH